MKRRALKPPSTICCVIEFAGNLPEWPRQEIVARLEEIVRRTPEDQLRIISQADGHAFPGDDEKHYLALKELIEVDNCRIDRNDKNISWFPLEPIELVAHVYRPIYEHAFAACTAILLIDDIEEDFIGYIEFRWRASEGKLYEQLRPEFKEPILAGVGHLIRRGDFEKSWLGNIM